MIPSRFVIEYPRRGLHLLKALEPIARRQEAIASFSLLAASAIFTIPYARLNEPCHPLRDGERDHPLHEALRRVNKQKFTQAEFWRGARPESWRFSRIVSPLDYTLSWRDEGGLHPMTANAPNTIEVCKVRKVLRVVRNALAHGNILYLDDAGLETSGAKVEHLAFLARHEQPNDPPPKTYDLVTAPEESFLTFVKSWARWLDGFPADDRLLFREAAD